MYYCNEIIITTGYRPNSYFRDCIGPSGLCDDDIFKRTLNWNGSQ